MTGAQGVKKASWGRQVFEEHGGGQRRGVKLSVPRGKAADCELAHRLQKGGLGRQPAREGGGGQRGEGLEGSEA